MRIALELLFKMNNFTRKLIFNIKEISIIVGSEAYHFEKLLTRGKSPRDPTDREKILIIMGKSSEDPIDWG